MSSKRCKYFGKQCVLTSSHDFHNYFGLMLQNVDETNRVLNSWKVTYCSGRQENCVQYQALEKYAESSKHGLQ
jgi:hypothetical protein